jgi:hypothetical protein
VETNPHDLRNLFAQSGLSGEKCDMDAFVRGHRLEPGTTMADAPFWSPVQAKFLRQALADDSDWSAAADELAVRLS